MNLWERYFYFSKIFIFESLGPVFPSNFRADFKNDLIMSKLDALAD